MHTLGFAAFLAGIVLLILGPAPGMAWSNRPIYAFIAMVVLFGAGALAVTR